MAICLALGAQVDNFLTEASEFDLEETLRVYGFRMNEERDDDQTALTLSQKLMEEFNGAVAYSCGGILPPHKEDGSEEVGSQALKNHVPVICNNETSPCDLQGDKIIFEESILPTLLGSTCMFKMPQLFDCSSKGQVGEDTTTDIRDVRETNDEIHIQEETSTECQDGENICGGVLQDKEDLDKVVQITQDAPENHRLLSSSDSCFDESEEVILEESAFAQSLASKESKIDDGAKPSKSQSKTATGRASNSKGFWRGRFSGGHTRGGKSGPRDIVDIISNPSDPSRRTNPSALELTPDDTNVISALVDVPSEELHETASC